MSYNYLPLDRKWLHFQQIKNLLDYDQLVSITFDAHERILQSREYLDSVERPVETVNNLEPTESEDVKASDLPTCEEVPADIVKLMLMLKIKSLSFGQSGVQIDTVKRLMEMYNNGALPVIYNADSLEKNGEHGQLSQLSSFLIGRGEVNYKGEKRNAGEVLQELNWQPVELRSYEAAALDSGTQFTCAYGLFALKKAEQLLKFADVLKALSLEVFEAEEKQTLQIESSKKHLPNSFSVTAQVHAAARNAFENMLAIFLKEINSVTENTLVFAEDNLIKTRETESDYSLTLATDCAKLAMTGVAEISAKRITHLIRQSLENHQNNEEAQITCVQVSSAAASIINQIKILATPFSLNTNSPNVYDDFLCNSASAAVNCVSIVNLAERVFAIELITAVKAFERGTTAANLPAVQKLVEDFNQYGLATFENNVFEANVVKAAKFINDYKV